MKNEDLINILIELPLDMEVERCKPLIEGSTIKFRAGCDQSQCPLMEMNEKKLKKTESTIKIMKGCLEAKGKAKETNDEIKRFLRGLYGLLNELEQFLWKRELE